MDNCKENNLEKEVLVEEYMLGKEYYNKLIENAKKEIKEKYQ